LTDLAEVAAGLGHRLHAAGLPVTPAQEGRFAAAVGVVAPTTTTELYWTARVTLVSDHAGAAVFDRVFDDVFRGIPDVMVGRQHAVPARHAKIDPPSSSPPRDGAPRPPAGGTDTAGEDGASVLAIGAATERERLGALPFDECTDEELATLRRLAMALAARPPMRASRRMHRHAHGRHLDVRSTLRRAHRTGGDPVHRTYRRPGVRLRKVVVLADVSGSMATFSRGFLSVLHGAVGGWHAEAFVFATRLTRLTRALAGPQPEVALRNAQREVADWSGGTRIGEALRGFNDRWGRRGMARGAVVVVVSDGWEAGDPALLARELQRLSLLAHRIVWVNPRKRSTRFLPATAGMAAALPFVDELVGGHSLEALDELLDAVTR
jgi:uncharacterized protein